MEPELQHELPEVELSELVVNLKKQKRYKEILQIFLNLLRIRLRSYLKSVNHDVPGEMNTSDLLSVFSSVLKQQTSISVLDSKLDQIILIEDYIITTRKPTQKQLKLYICYAMDLYYQLHDFDPRYLTADFRTRIVKMLRKQDNPSSLAKNLRFMQPLVRYVTEFKKSNSFLRKLNPFRSATISIPKSVSPILKEYVESKFNEEVSNVQQENQNIKKMIEKTLELDEMKKTLMDAFDVVSPTYPESELLRRRSLSLYLLCTSSFMIVLGGMFLFQIALFSRAWSVFLMFGIIPFAIAGFCLYIFMNLRRAGR